MSQIKFIYISQCYQIISEVTSTGQISLINFYIGLNDQTKQFMMSQYN